MALVHLSTWKNHHEIIRKETFSEVSYQDTLNDIRGSEKNYSLDTDGFQILSGVSSAATYETFESDKDIRATCFPELEELLLRAVPDASKVSPKAAEQRLLQSIPDPEEAQALLKGRYRIINVWKPLNGKVETMPLAFTTAASVAASDLIEIERRYPDFTGATMGLKHWENHKWLYWSLVGNYERILLGCFDDKEGVAQRTPHAAFRDPRSTPQAKLRESIEVRTLVF
ncbi:hypothetical protein N7488_010428 [Penicillium malachiteum]|nr:hypothetical protein N7488_010428 [Penicillium malachiteum]